MVMSSIIRWRSGLTGAEFTEASCLQGMAP